MHSGQPPESFGPKYKPIKVVGRGTWGVVTQCRGENGEIVALKTFEGADKNELVRKVAVREAKVLKQVDHPNIVKLMEVFRTKSNLYLVFEFVDFTLLDCIQRHRYGVPHVQLTTLLLQLAQAIDFLHQRKIIHRDLKPENTLVTKDGQVKLADFGFARSVPQLEGQWTAYVSTRWYRAPEMLLGSEYGAAADIWAFGCILAEMATGRPLFPGSSDLDQLHQIMCTTGICPSQKELIKGHAGLNRLTAGFPEEPLVSLNARLPNVDPSIVAVVKACLRPDPKARPSSSQLLQFDFFQGRREAHKSSSMTRPSTVPANPSRPPPTASNSEDSSDSMFGPTPAMTTLGEPGLGVTTRRSLQNNPMQGTKKPILSVRPSEARHSQLSSSLRDCDPEGGGGGTPKFTTVPQAFSPQPPMQPPMTPPFQSAFAGNGQYGSAWTPGTPTAFAQTQGGMGFTPPWGGQAASGMPLRTAQYNMQQQMGPPAMNGHQMGWTNGTMTTRMSDGGQAHRQPSAAGGGAPRVSDTGLLAGKGTGFKLDLKGPTLFSQSGAGKPFDRSGSEAGDAAPGDGGVRNSGVFARGSLTGASTDVSQELAKLRISLPGQGPPQVPTEPQKQDQDALFAPRKEELRLPALT